ncbi:MAG: molybdopterin molybdotransferase MoeA [Mariniphaga sp.]|nr:molybdopterin molybdotransferase MoeA [Mariniphaga sp.]
MLEFKTALDLIRSTAQPLPAEKVELQKSLKRVLAEDVFHDMDMPPFNKSAMDGFACRREDLHNELEIIETIYAGKLPEKRLKENQCYKIMTGAVVPDGADVVFKKEDARLFGDSKVVCQNQKTGNNICYRGEDIKTGEKVLEKGTLLLPRHLPALASAGITHPAVFRRPVVTVFSTGTELVEPGEKPLSFQIRNSNAAQLIGQISELNIQAGYGGIIRDDESLLTEKLTGALNFSDVVMLTGGVSVGDFDLIPEILSKMDYDILVTATAIKPGKPMVFARKGQKFCFGLSGNPVSSFVQFELYAKPFLFALMGYNFQPEILKLPFGTELKWRKQDRLNFIPVNIIDEMEVLPVEFHGSAHINSLSKATHLMEVPKGVEKIEKGELVNVRSL